MSYGLMRSDMGSYPCTAIYPLYTIDNKFDIKRGDDGGHKKECDFISCRVCKLSHYLL